MTHAELLHELLRGSDRSFSYPLAPSSAADLIVRELLNDLPPERQEQVREAIEDWGTEWGCSSAATGAESTYR